MTAPSQPSAPQAAYRGLWKLLAGWFQVPEGPPPMPRGRGGRTFRPAPAFLTYLRLSYWIRTAVVASGAVFGAVIFAGLILFAALEGGAPVLVVAGLAVLGAGVLALVGAWAVLDYAATQLRYDTTWYAMTDGTLRIRRGIWLIRETTVTFANVQNVRVRQGPLQRWLGIANVTLETAAAGPQAGNEAASEASKAVVEGVADAVEIRDRIAARMRASGGAGLGDEDEPAGRRAGGGWTEEHVRVLREVKEEVGRVLGRG